MAVRSPDSPRLAALRRKAAVYGGASESQPTARIPRARIAGPGENRVVAGSPDTQPASDSRSGVLTTITNSVTGAVTHRELTVAELAALTAGTGGPGASSANGATVTEADVLGVIAGVRAELGLPDERTGLGDSAAREPHSDAVRYAGADADLALHVRTINDEAGVGERRVDGEVGTEQRVDGPVRVDDGASEVVRRVVADVNAGRPMATIATPAGEIVFVDAPATPVRAEESDPVLQRRAAERISQALKWAAPQSAFFRWLGFHNNTASDILSYDLAGSVSKVLTSDYQGRRFWPSRRKPHLKRVETAKYGIKEKGTKNVYTKPGEIEPFIREFTQDLGNAQSLEAMLLYGIIEHGETNRWRLPKRNIKHLESIIVGAYRAGARTAIEEINDGEGQDRKVVLYFPHVEKHRQTRGAKIIQVVTNESSDVLTDPEAQAAAFERAHQLVANPQVAAVVRSIAEKTVSIEQTTNDTVVITDLQGNKRAISLSAGK